MRTHTNAGWACQSSAARWRVASTTTPTTPAEPATPPRGQRDAVARCAPALLGTTPPDAKPAPLRHGLPCDGNTVLL